MHQKYTFLTYDMCREQHILPHQLLEISKQNFLWNGQFPTASAKASLSEN